jgi:hypothetical protein
VVQVRLLNAVLKDYQSLVTGLVYLEECLIKAKETLFLII